MALFFPLSANALTFTCNNPPFTSASTCFKKGVDQLKAITTCNFSASNLNTCEIKKDSNQKTYWSCDSLSWDCENPGNKQTCRDGFVFYQTKKVDSATSGLNIPSSYCKDERKPQTCGGGGCGGMDLQSEGVGLGY